jgi:hypothetical protein
VPVCQAIQHAHTKGIIHRDIKPSNVLVALHDDRPVPKVIDFGIAKAAGQQLTDATLVTGFGAVLGTPEYMSPEQAQLNQLDIDTRSDVYALGVLLYELLTGTTPIDRKRLGQAAMLEILRLIREEEPPRPSTRLSTSEGLAGIAAARKTEPARLAKLMRGELDWIVMKCLEKDRTRRYETANGLAQDVQRFLADETVEACPPSAGYRLRKFARKYKGLLAGAAALAAVLLVGIAVSTYFAIEAERRATAERVERKRAQAAEDNLEQESAQSLLGPIDPQGEKLNQAEVETLWRLAGTKSERVRRRFLEEAMRTPDSMLRLNHRSEWLLHAWVGLHPQRRETAERLLVQGMQDTNKNRRLRTEIAWVALELSDWRSPTHKDSAEVIRRGWAAEENPDIRDTWREVLLARAERVAPAQAARLLNQALAQEKNADARKRLVHRLAARPRSPLGENGGETVPKGWNV